MSTVLHDVASHALVAPTYGPATTTSNQSGSAVDLIDADGQGFAVLSVGSLSAGGTVGGKVQESADGSTNWADLATFASITTANTAKLVRFTRTARYVRGTVTITGSSPSAGVGVVVGQQKKTV